MKQKENAAKEYVKAIKTAEALSETLKNEIEDARSRQKKFEKYQGPWHSKYDNQGNRVLPSSNLHIYKKVESRFKSDADEKTAEKSILDQTIKTVKENIGTDETTSTETLLATAKHLNAMANVIDPPFNYQKLPGILLYILGSLSTLTGFGLLIAGITVVTSILLLPVITLPALLVGGGAAAGLGAILWYEVEKNDSEALRGCKQLQQIESGQDFTSSDTSDKSTIYYTVENDSTIKTRWYENNGTQDGITKEGHITDQTKCQKILSLAEDQTVDYFDEIVALLGYPSLTVQTLNVQKAAFAKATLTELTELKLVGPVAMPSSSSTSTTATGIGPESTRSSKPFSEPTKTAGGKEPTATPTSGPERSTKDGNQPPQ